MQFSASRLSQRKFNGDLLGVAILLMFINYNYNHLVPLPIKKAKIKKNTIPKNQPPDISCKNPKNSNITITTITKAMHPKFVLSILNLVSLV